MIFFIESFDSFFDRPLDKGIWLDGFIYIIEREAVVVRQFAFVESPRFAHTSSEQVSVRGVFVERFGSPDKDLCMLSGFICHAHGPYGELASLIIESRNMQLSAKAFVFMKGVAQDTVR